MEPTAQSGGPTQFSQPTMGGMPPGADPLVAASMQSAQSAVAQPVAPVQAVAPTAPVQYATAPQMTAAPVQPTTFAQPATQPVQQAQPSQPVQPMQGMAEPMGAVDFGGTMSSGAGVESKDISSLIDEELAKPAAPAKQETVAPVEPMQKPAKKVNGMLIGMIVSIVVAVAGIAFGIIMMTQKTDSETRLNKQITSLKGQISELSAQLDGQSGTDEEDDATGEANYLSIADWGIEIAIPNGLSYVSSRVAPSADGSNSVAYITGVISGNYSAESLPSFINLNVMPEGLGAVIRQAEVCPTNADGSQSLIFSDGTYNYCLMQRTDTGVVYPDDAEMAQLYADSVLAINDMLSDPNNYESM